MIGRVVSVKMEKTAVILVEGKKTHPLYKKTYKSSKKFLVHDEIGVTNGDIVVVSPIRPMSKRKHFQITKVLGKDIVSLEQAELQVEAAEAIAESLPEDKKDEALAATGTNLDIKDEEVKSEEKQEEKVEEEKEAEELKKPKKTAAVKKTKEEKASKE